MADRRNIVDRLTGGEMLLMDGGTGSELQRRGVDVLKGATDRLKAWSATSNIENADVVQQVHQDYLARGRGHHHQQQLLDDAFGDGAHRAARPVEGLCLCGSGQRDQGKGRREPGCLRGGRHRGPDSAARSESDASDLEQMGRTDYAMSMWSTRSFSRMPART